MPDHSMRGGLAGPQAAEWILTHSGLSPEEIEAVRQKMRETQRPPVGVVKIADICEEAGIHE